MSDAGSRRCGDHAPIYVMSDEPGRAGLNLCPRHARGAGPAFGKPFKEPFPTCDFVEREGDHGEE